MAAREETPQSDAISRKDQIGAAVREAPPQNRHVRQQSFARAALLCIAGKGSKTWHDRQ